MKINGWKIAKYLLYGFLGLLLLIAILLAFTQTGIFKSWLKGKIENQAATYLSGQLKIGSLHGNLFTNVNLENITLTADKDTVLAIDKLAFGYNILGILSKHIEIDSMIIASPKFHAVQNDSGVWNFSKLVAAGGSSDTASGSSGFGYDLTLKRFSLGDGSVIVQSPDTLIPRKVDSLNIILSLQYKEPDYQVSLDSLYFNCANPGFRMENTAAALNGNDNRFALENLDIRTALNRLNARGTYYFESDKDTEFEIKTDSLQLSEFSPFVPGLPLGIHPVLQLNLDLVKDSLAYDIALDGDGYKTTATGFINRLREYLRDSTTILSYGLNGNFENIDLAEFLSDSTMRSSINGHASLTGSGTTPESADIIASADFKQCRIMQNDIKAFSADLNYKNGDGSGRLSLNSEYGSTDLRFTGKNLLQTPQITSDGTVRHLDISGFVSGQDKSDINLGFDARTTGLNPDSMTANVKLNVGKSTYNTIPIDTVMARLRISPGRYRVDTLFAKSEEINLAASGEIDNRHNSRIAYRMNIGDLSYFDRFVDSLDIGGSADITGDISGRPDSLLVTASVDGKHVFYDTYRAEQLTGQNEIKLYPSLTEITGKSSLQNIFVNDNINGSSQIEYTATRDSADIILDTQLADSVSMHLESSIKMDSLIRIYLTDLVVDLKSQRWHSAYDLTKIVVDSDMVSIDSLLLISNGQIPSKQQRIRLAGRYLRRGPLDLRLSAKNIDLAVVSGLGNVPVKLGGLLDYSLDVKGTAENPNINSRLTLDTVSFNNYIINRTSGSLAYDSSGLYFNLELVPTGVDSFAVDGKLPVTINLADMTYDLDRNAPFKADMFSNKFPLRTISGISSTVEKIDGVINAEVHASNTIDNPTVKGNIAITGSNLQIPKYGIEFNKFGSLITFKDNRAVLDSMIFSRDKGSLVLKGDVKFEGGILEGNITATQFDMKANDIFLAKQKYYQIQIAGNAALISNADSAKYSGNITVLRSNFYLPALMKEYGNGSTAEPKTKPMLVEAAGWDTLKTADTTVADTVSADTTYRIFADFMNRLQGKINISFPRNTWIRSPEMRMEISGDLDIVKEGPDFEIFGTVSVIRGHYDLYGKRFNIKEGKLIFQGSPEINPNITLAATYSFRTPSREKKTLTLNATGSARTPELSFQLDGQAISEGDAASYIAFGRSLNELTYGQRSGLTSSSGSGSSEGSFAKGVAANIIAGQLAKTLGNSLSLDVIEINASNDWQSASFVVGKYITNDLFVSYQRDVGDVQNNDVTPETVTLEYELTKRIFLQLIEGNSTDSGFDVFFKFQNK